MHQPAQAATHATPDNPNITTADLRRAAWASSVGSALEYYDMALYSLAAALIFTPLFFPGGDPTTGLILSFGTYFIGFGVRPIGGIIFGRLGDRLGRKFVLMATVAMMGIASTLIGFLPTYNDNPGDWYGSGVGILAPVLLIVLRVVQGLGAGAEMAGASILMTEYSPRQRRGFFASLPFMGVQVGTVVAALIYFVLSGAGGSTVTSTWWWRIPFLASFVLVLVAIYLRLKLKESPTFQKLEAREQIADHPMRELLTNSRGTLLRGIGLRMAENGSSSIYQALAVAYVTSAAVGIKGPIGALSLVFAATLGAVMVPIAGALSDRYGRVRVYRAFAIFQLVAAFPIWWALSQGSTVVTIIVISLALGVGTWGMFGSQSAFMTELFGSRHRYLGVSVAREVSAVISGGLAPLIGAGIIAAVVSSDGGADVPGAGLGAWVFIAGYTTILCAITVATTFVTPDPTGRNLEDSRDALTTQREKDTAPVTTS
ncbi:MHS family MFS transporter [Saccharopolyspora erythraea]|uniref:MFS transporter n=1 Tax=Saccharopolyspora erythraea TaxID=1836 RepID=UPI001BAB8EC1|nr:MFS transporter [Saccharopolyspora erythraea]QUH04194.1 MHS family MFS transporter [Saccharopolyspora erythraea]